MDMNQANLQALDTAVTTVFNQSILGHEPMWDKIAMRVNSSSAGNFYPKITDVPKMREWFGDRVIEKLDISGFTLPNRTFEGTISVPVNAVDDDEYGFYTNQAGELGQAASEMPDDIVFEQLLKGFDTPHFDGQNFFDTDHPVQDEAGNEVSVSNFQGGTGRPWFLIDTSRMLKPLIFQDRMSAQLVAKTNLTDPNVFMKDELIWGTKSRAVAGFGVWQFAYASKEPLTEANYEAARAALASIPGHRGRKTSIKGTDLFVGSLDEGAGRRLLENSTKTNGGENEWFGTAKLHVTSYLD